MLEAADANQDGLIQVHEFLSWVMEQKPQYFVEEKKDEVLVTMTNPSTTHPQHFVLQLRNVENGTLRAENPCTVVVKPGEQITKPLLSLKQPARYSLKVTMRHGQKPESKSEAPAENFFKARDVFGVQSLKELKIKGKSKRPRFKEFDRHKS